MQTVINYVAFVTTCLAIVYIVLIAFIKVTRGKKKSKKIAERSIGTTILKGSKSVVGAYSIIGDRDYQQDNVLVDEDLPCGGKMAVLCDGMGGMESGGEASLLCVRTFQEDCRQDIYDPATFLKEEALKLNDMVCDMTGPNGEEIESGTTLVALLCVRGRVHWVNVGDSRVYMWRNKNLARLTVDHNYALQLQEQVNDGTTTLVEAMQAPRQDALVSYIGIDVLERIDVGGNFPIQQGDIYMLCSDGVNKALSDEKLQQFFETYHEKSASTIAKELIELAMQHKRPNQDNTTVAIMKC